MSEGQFCRIAQLDRDTLMVSCVCTTYHHAYVYSDHDDAQDSCVYLSVTAQPASVRGRLKGAVRSLFGRSWHESAEIVLDEAGAAALIAALNGEVRR